MTNSAITVYGAPWCPDCRRSKQFLGEQRVAYEWTDIDHDDDAREYVSRINDGRQIIPTIVFEDGSFLAEPTDAELAAKLGISPKAERQHYDLIVVGGGPAGLTASLYAAREGMTRWLSSAAGSAARPASPRGSTTTPASRTASAAVTSPTGSAHRSNASA